MKGLSMKTVNKFCLALVAHEVLTLGAMLFFLTAMVVTAICRCDFAVSTTCGAAAILAGTGLCVGWRIACHKAQARRREMERAR